VGENPSLGGVTPGELRGDRGGGRGRRKFPVPWVSNIDCCRPPGKVGRFVCLTHLLRYGHRLVFSADRETRCTALNPGSAP
jgi:hypothetical protein